MSAKRPILAVLVLYRLGLDESPAYRTLRAALAEDAALAASFELLVFDNSPAPQTVPAELGAAYLHDGRNAGLAARYNEALERALRGGHAWLLLLDQDTQLTPAYLREAVQVARELAEDRLVVAAVPKLLEAATLQSPHRPFYRRSPLRLDAAAHGVLHGLVRAYNSGALLRVSALQAIGGFPQAYWLDYLDHATFHRLQAAGGRVYLMHAALEHAMSIHREERHTDPAHAARHRNQLAAQNRFYQEHGSLGERLLQRADLLKQALRPLRYGHFADARRMVLAAFGIV